MTRYEIKKVFSKNGGKVAILILLLLLGLTCYFATDVYYVDESGAKQKGYAAVSKLRAAQNEWAGVLDEEKLRHVIEENQRINETPQARSQDYMESNIAYGWKQGFDGIRSLLNESFARGFREYDYYRADSLSVEDAPKFYVNRIALLKEWLADEAENSFSDAEKAYLVKQYENLEVPFYYDYTRGWFQFFEYSGMIIMIAMLVIGYLLAGIFAGEFAWKSDSVFFSSMYGRNRAIVAKINAGFNIVTVIYWTMMSVYSLIVLGYLGIDGWNCPVQASWTTWKCFYNIKIWQEYLLVVLGGYIGCLFISFLTMFISAKTRSADFAVIVPFVIVFIPSFVSNINSSSINKVLGLLPDRLLEVGAAINYFDLYGFGEKVYGAVPILFVLYGVMAVLLVPLMYREYRHKQVG